MAPTMRAAQYDNENKKVLVHDIPIPEPEEGQIQIKIAAASLCHSDLMHYQRPKKGGPITMGHEALGTISKLHPSAEGKGFKVGDKIGMHCVADSCWDCEGCRVHSTFCQKPKNGYPKIQGLQYDGFFAEYAVTDWQNAVHMPDGLPTERMSPLFCAGITAFHAVDKCGLEPGQWYAIVGCGGLGQMALKYAKAMKLKVVCLDINDRILERMKQEGADATFNPKDNPNFFKEIRKMLGRRGVHGAAVFSDSNAAYDAAYRSLGIEGVLMFVGLPQKPVSIPAFAVSMEMVKARGASNGRASEMKKAVDFTAKHQIIPDVEFRTLDEMPEMVEALAAGKTERRMVVRFGDAKSKM